MTRVLYNQVKKVQYAGLTCDSKLEVRRYKELMLLQMAKEIHMLEYHPKPIVVTIKGQKVFEYRPDFTFMRGSDVVVHEIKGFETPVFRLKWKILKALHPDVIFEIWTGK